MPRLRRLGVWFGLGASLVCFCWLLSTWVFAAADHDLRPTITKPWVVEDVATGAAKLIVLPDNDVLISHLGYQSDGSASVSTDYVVVMRKSDEAGAAVSMAANLNAGVKLPIKQGGSATIRSGDIPDGPDGPREIQVQAVGNSAKILVIRGIRSK